MPRLSSLVVLALFVAVPCAAQGTAQRAVGDVAPPAATGVSARAVPIDSLRLAPGDVLRVAVWREKSLDGDFPVDANGDVSLPMLGRRHVAAVPWAAVRDSLLRAYEWELRGATITLTPLRRVYVLGSVTKPGVYLLETTFDVAGAITKAGGATPEGDLDQIRIVRRGRTVASHLSLATTASDYGLFSGDELFVDRRSWLDRNSAVLLSSLLSIAGIIVATRSRP